jgi:hypothetical protein
MEFLEIMGRVAYMEGLREDQEIAACLGLSKQSYAGYKSRGSVPLVEIVSYCIKKGRSVDQVLFGVDPPYANRDLLEENKILTEKFKTVENLLIISMGKGGGD